MNIENPTCISIGYVTIKATSQLHKQTSVLNMEIRNHISHSLIKKDYSSFIQDTTRYEKLRRIYIYIYIYIYITGLKVNEKSLFLAPLPILVHC